MINIDELNKERNDRMELKKNTYETILKQCHNRIKIVAKAHNNLACCFFIVPKYIYGLPIYDSYSCITYLVNALINNGFDVKYTHPNLLYISWLNKSNPKLAKKKEIYKDHREIAEYRPSNNLIYNNNSLNLFTKKTNNLLNN